MKFLSKGKDGGPDSTVTGYWLIEIKRLFSIALLRFDAGSREQYHTHAFNSTSWLLSGHLREEMLGYDGTTEFVTEYRPSVLPIKTFRRTFHRVFSIGTSWVLTFRGPWSRTWFEYDPNDGLFSRLADGRNVIRRFA